MVVGFNSCSGDDSIMNQQPPEPGPNPDPNTEPEPNPNQNKNLIMNIKIGSDTFTATLEDNATASTFRDMLPMTMGMSELNNNEKFYTLPQNLPVNTYSPGTINNGDIMLYGSSTLVLFYKNFSTSYSYTRIGSISNPSGLQSALGSGSVTVTFEMAE